MGHRETKYSHQIQTLQAETKRKEQILKTKDSEIKELKNNLVVAKQKQEEASQVQEQEKLGGITVGQLNSILNKFANSINNSDNKTNHPEITNINTGKQINNLVT